MYLLSSALSSLAKQVAVIPIYMDTVASLVDTIRKKIQLAFIKTDESKKEVKSNLPHHVSH